MHAESVGAESRGTVLGTGFIALDVVVSSRTPEHRATWAGGTCGNVLSILSYLGWGAYPLSRMNGDGAAARVRRDLSRWGVRLDFASLTPTASTPVVIHHIMRRPNGEAIHRFAVRCPDCGARMPSYRPVTKANAESVADQLPQADLFFFDRVSRATLILAEKASQAGAIVVFEPCGIGDPPLFREALALADVLKYSRERLGWLAESSEFERDPLLEIETMGQEGLRYRGRISARSDHQWRVLRPYRPWRIVDGAGAGDWCTAGILHVLGSGGREALANATQDQVEEALCFGQAAGAWACAFEGARGGMYKHTLKSFFEQISALRTGRTGDEKDDPHGSVDATPESTTEWCPVCTASDRVDHPR